MPLDVRVKQHQAVLDEGMLDESWTVMGIWPAPMIYAGPTEVQFHAASRRNCGASYFVVGRDAAGMKGSELAQWSPDDDLYNADHARYVLQVRRGFSSVGVVDAPGSPSRAARWLCVGPSRESRTHCVRCFPVERERCRDSHTRRPAGHNC